MFRALTTICAAVAGITFLSDGVGCALGKEPNKSTTASSQSAIDDSNHQFGKHLEPILETISATVEQRKQITTIFDDFRPRIEPLRVKYKARQTEFISCMTSGRTAEEIMVKQTELNEVYGQITNEYFLMHMKIRKLLTQEQCAKYEAYRRAQGWRR